MNNPNPPVPNPLQPQPPPRSRRPPRRQWPSSLRDLRERLKGVKLEYKREYLPYYALGCAVIALALFVCGLVTLIMLSVLNQPRVADNVTVNGIPMGGRTFIEADDLLRRTFDNATITLVDEVDTTRRFTVSLSDLGITVDIPQTLERVKNAQRGERITPIYTFNERRAEDSLLSLRAQIDVSPLAGNPPIDGRSIDIPFMVERLRADAVGELADGTMEVNMLVVQAADAPTLSGGAEPLTHIVASGESLISIAELYGVTVNDIVALNQLEDANLIFEGQELLIPAAAAP